MKKIIITGSNGFLGRHLKKEILKQFPNCEIIEFIRDKIDLREKIEFKIESKDKIDYIFHLATCVSAGIEKDHSTIFIENNLINMNVLDYWRNNIPNAKFITFGTSASYNNNTDINNYFNSKPDDTNSGYVWSKRMLLEGLKMISSKYKKMKWVYFIPSTLFGEDFSKKDNHLIPDIIRKIYNGKKIFNAQNNIRNYIYINDACKIILNLSKKSKNNELYNICSYSNITIYNLISKIGNLINKKIKVNKLETYDYFDREMLPEFDFEFSDFEQSLKKTINWYKINN